MTLFIDSSVWFAGIVARDNNNARAQQILREFSERTTTDHVFVETWGLLTNRHRRDAAESFWDGVRRGAAQLEFVTPADLEVAWTIGEAFPDQNFSLVDRTSFAAMERTGITRVASFDSDFAIYRYARDRKRAFEVVR